MGGGHAPCLAKVGRITHGVDRFLIINSDNDAALVAKLVFVGLAANHRPRHASIGAQESIGLFVRAEGGANRPDAHHEPGSGGGKYAPEVMRDGDGMQVKGAVFCVGGVATDLVTFAVLCRRTKRGPGTSCKWISVNVLDS